MKTNTILFWITTVLVALVALGGGIMDIIANEEVLAAITGLGFPEYFARPLGIFKVLGSIAILIPGFYRIKEWAYAGLSFDFIWAVIAHGSNGDEMGQVLFPLIPLALLLASYFLYHRRKADAGEWY